MAAATGATEVEDLAALVGIEILPDSSNEAVSSRTDLLHDSPDIKDSFVTDEAGQPIQEADTNAMCSSQRLQALEAQFADRYSQADEGFLHTLDTPTHPPPCVSPWWANDRGGGDRSRGRGGQGWGRGRGHPERRDYGGRGDYHQRSHSYHDNRYQGHRQDNWGRRDHYRDRDSSRHRERSPNRRDRF